MKNILVPIFLVLWYTGFSQTIFWNGAGDGTSWEDPMNWDLERVPNASDHAYIAANTANVSVVISTAVAEVAYLELYAEASFILSFDIQALAHLSIIDPNSLFGSGIYGLARTAGEILFTNLGEIVIQKDPSNFDDPYGIFFESGAGPPFQAGTYSFVNRGNIFITDLGRSALFFQQNATLLSPTLRAKIENYGFIKATNTATEVSEPAFDVLGALDFLNAGTIIFDRVSNTVMELESGANFTNSGCFQITGMVTENLIILDDQNTTFTNSGLLELDATPTGSPSLTGIGIPFNGNFINTACGVVNVGERLEIFVRASSNLSNAGIITSAFTGDHSAGDDSFVATNTGEIRTPDGNGNGLNINGGTTTMGPIPATMGLLSPLASASNQEIDGTMLTLDGNDPGMGTGAWRIVNGDGNGYFEDTPGTLTSNIPDAKFTGTRGETYTLEWKITLDDCESKIHIMITFSCLGLTASASNQEIDGTLLTLDGNDPGMGKGEWRIVSGDGNGYFGDTPGTLTSNMPDASFTGTRGETYTLEWEISAGICESNSIQVMITFSCTGLTASANIQEIAGTRLMLDGNDPGSGTGQWSIISGDGNGYFGDTPGTLTTNNPISTFAGTPRQAYTLEWKIIEGNCESSVQIMLTIPDVEEIPLFASLWEKLGFSVLLLGLMSLFMYHRKF